MNHCSKATSLRRMRARTLKRLLSLPTRNLFPHTPPLSRLYFLQIRYLPPDSSILLRSHSNLHLHWPHPYKRSPEICTMFIKVTQDKATRSPVVMGLILRPMVVTPVTRVWPRPMPNDGLSNDVFTYILPNGISPLLRWINICQIAHNILPSRLLYIHGLRKWGGMLDILNFHFLDNGCLHSNGGTLVSFFR